MDIAENNPAALADAPQKASGESHRAESEGSIATRLVASATLMLFVELALIRWLGSNVIHLSYFSNFVLLGSFLGIGAGFLISRKSWSIWPWSLPLLTLLTVGVIRYPMSIQREGGDIIYFTALELGGPPAWLALPLIFCLVAVILAGPAELVGRCFAKLPALKAYRWDLIGSLAGIVAFSVLSFLHAPSIVWGLVAGALYIALSEKRRRLATIAWTLPLLVILFNESRVRTSAGRPITKSKRSKPNRISMVC